jgi:hypothetical protein
VPDGEVLGTEFGIINIKRYLVENLGCGNRGNHKGLPLQRDMTPHDNGLCLDIFGSVFFMLSRYEEAVKSERSENGCCGTSFVCADGEFDLITLV